MVTLTCITCHRLVEEADFRAAQELFGSDKTLDTLEPKYAVAPSLVRSSRIEYELRCSHSDNHAPCCASSTRCSAHELWLRDGGQHGGNAVQHQSKAFVAVHVLALT